MDNPQPSQAATSWSDPLEAFQQRCERAESAIKLLVSENNGLKENLESLENKYAENDSYLKKRAFEAERQAREFEARCNVLNRKLTAFETIVFFLAQELAKHV